MPPDLSPEAAVAVEKTKAAQAAVEISREAQLEQAVQKTAQETKKAVLEGLQEVFKEADREDPEHMVIIHSKIPVLCVRVNTIDKNIEELKENNKWMTRIIIGGVIASVVANFIT